MDIQKLQEHAQKLLRFSVDQLKETGSVDPMFELIRADESIDVVLIDGPVINDNSSKALLSRMVQAKVDAGELQAVLFVSDVFHATMDERANTIRRTLGLNVEQAHAAGICEKHEAIMVIIDSPIHREVFKQSYKRDGDAIELGDLLRQSEADGTKYVGRMIDFFKRKPTQGKPS